VKRPKKLRDWLSRKAATRVPDLGPRELDVLDRLWKTQPLTAAELVHQLDVNVVTLSTMQSTLERLHRKGMVNRKKQGRAFVYRASLTRPQLISLMFRDLAEDFGNGDPAPLISGFVDFAAGDDPSMRRELDRLLGSDVDVDGNDD
jgi:predicted transcriptional regulator